jgi:hypothetical protein
MKKTALLTFLITFAAMSSFGVDLGPTRQITSGIRAAKKVHGAVKTQKNEPEQPKDASVKKESVQSTESSILPFGVKVGGQKAIVSGNKLFAKVAKPVSANAALVVDAEAEMVIINIFKSDKEGNAIKGAQPAIIMIQGGNKTKLDSTMDKKPLEPGNYIMNVVISTKGTSRVMFTVK